MNKETKRVLQGEEAKTVLSEGSDTYEQLYKAVKDHSDLEDGSIMDAADHGADSGYTGFIYNKDCVDFYNKNEDMIEEFAQEQAEEFGHDNIFEMAVEFNRKEMLTQGLEGFKVLMSWFVLEEVGRWLEQRKDKVSDEAGGADEE